MNDQGVTTHALSLTTPFVYWASPERGVELARIVNDSMVEAHTAYPNRFVGCATLPIQAPELAVKELDRLAGSRAIRGAYMPTSVSGKELSDPSLFPIYAVNQGSGIASPPFDRAELRGRQGRRPDFQLSAAEGNTEGVDHDGVELAPGPLDDDVSRVERRHRLSVGSVARQGVVDIGNGDDTRLERNGFPARRVVAGAIEFVVVREDDRDDPAQRSTDGLQHVDTLRDMFLDLLIFLARQLGRLVEELPADIELADIVKQRRGANVLDTIGIQIELRSNSSGIY